MKTLSYGYEKPESNDTGSTVFPALQRDIQKLNDHSHNGSNSAFIPVVTQSISSGSWALDPALNTNSQYSQTVTVPNSRNYDDVSIQVRRSSGEMVYATIEKATATTYKIYTNDNTLNYTAIYST